MHRDSFSDCYGKLFPELELFPNRNARKLAVRKARNIAFWNWYTPIVVVALGMVVTLGRTYVESVTDVSPMLLAALAGLATGTLGVPSLILLSIRRIRLALRHELQHCGIQVCLKCGYRLSGIESNVCPECGTRFDAQQVEGGRQDDV